MTGAGASFHRQRRDEAQLNRYAILLVDEFVQDASQVSADSLKHTPAEVAVLGSVHMHHACESSADRLPRSIGHMRRSQHLERPLAARRTKVCIDRGEVVG